MCWNKEVSLLSFGFVVIVASMLIKRNQKQMKNSAIELIKYEARSSKFPDGRMVIAANVILLEDRPLPIGEIPFAKFDDILIGDRGSDPTDADANGSGDAQNDEVALAVFAAKQPQAIHVADHIEREQQAGGHRRGHDQ